MARAEPGHRFHRRGLTLIEILVALGLLLALSALVLPISSWAFRLGSLESARDGVEAIILRSRAEARLEGRAIELGFVDGRFEARWFDPSAVAPDEDFESEWLADVEFDAADPEEDFRISASWSRRALAPGITFLFLDAYLLERDAFEPFDLADDEPPSFESDPYQPTGFMRIAVFLPDGGALVGRPFVLREEGSPPMRVEIDPWSARPIIAELPPDSFDDALLEEEESEEEEVGEEDDAGMEPIEPEDEPSSADSAEPPPDIEDLLEESET